MQVADFHPTRFMTGKMLQETDTFKELSLQTVVQWTPLQSHLHIYMMKYILLTWNKLRRPHESDVHLINTHELHSVTCELQIAMSSPLFPRYLFRATGGSLS